MRAILSPALAREDAVAAIREFLAAALEERQAALNGASRRALTDPAARIDGLRLQGQTRLLVQAIEDLESILNKGSV
jgi:hypothetical protein